MSKVVLVAFTLGAVLGAKFKVMVLAPAIFILAILGAYGIAGGDSIWSMLLIEVLALVSLQFGYLLGITLTKAGRAPEIRRHVPARDAS